MEEHRLPLRAYKMLLNLDQRGKTNWVTRVRRTLCANGFSYVWDTQGRGCLNAFVGEFRQRLTDIGWQAWHGHINTSNTDFRCTDNLKHQLVLNLHNVKFKQIHKVCTDQI